jgi:diaminopimelate dehydrogenase
LIIYFKGDIGMSQTIRTVIVGYGNLGRGVESALKQNPDFELEAIFTRRDPKTISAQSSFVHISKISEYQDRVDVAILCGGSATDLPVQGPELAAIFNTVDSFDTHANIPDYYARMNSVSKKAGTVSVISTGWDPGLFSLNRLIQEAVLPDGKSYTFWGKGVSQGHSDAIRRIAGVKDAKQYTIPVESAVSRVRNGENPELTTAEKHTRLCYVVAEPGADLERIQNEIVTMPNYFSDYNTTVNFISEDEMKRDHSGMPHGGQVIRTGLTGTGTKQRMEFSLELGSNPEFTGSILVAYARAAYRLSNDGQNGAFTVLDIPISYLSAKSTEELRGSLL